MLKDPYEDSLHIREKILEELDSKGNDVVLVVHSYGGLCGANSCEGLAKKDREGKNTSVIGVVYLCVSFQSDAFAAQCSSTIRLSL